MAEVDIVVRTIGPSRPSHLRVASRIKVAELRKLLASDKRLPLEQLKLVLRGKILRDENNGADVYLDLKEGDSLMVAIAPKPPAGHVGNDDEDDDLRFRIPQSASRWKRTIFTFLQQKMKLPDIMLMVLFSISLKGWAIIVIWFSLAPVAHKWDLGPLYMLGTGFAIILLNLGHRQQGDLSAFSIFNEGFRELPGTLNAERLDRDLRAGQF
ncbi:hypothetical protein H6P81_005152 [Aristolochia fimbriata]|uniref:Ubiquitin-like domain-containing protein n=1 Tax=Aristolochia fimbriata TaxID=158543 RepID=A0AAV7EU67_ARIFI|nr:hypothetical protein H6P81_005152 [Aristolochia fimbriata]